MYMTPAKGGICTHSGRDPRDAWVERSAWHPQFPLLSDKNGVVPCTRAGSKSSHAFIGSFHFSSIYILTFILYTPSLLFFIYSCSLFFYIHPHFYSYIHPIHRASIIPGTCHLLVFGKLECCAVISTSIP